MICILCNSDDVKNVCTKKILKKYNVNYYQCQICGLLFTENPYWLDEAYSEALSMTDTGAIMRNIDTVITVSAIINSFYKKDNSFLDYGGGYGIFVRMMRDRGYNFYWLDKYAKPLLCKGFEFKNQKIALTTSFECLEHMVSPQEDLDIIFSNSDDVLVSTKLYAADFNVPDDSWEYYSLNTGQHVTFYSAVTFNYLANKYNMNYYFLYGIHWFSKRKLSKIKLCLLKLKIRLRRKTVGIDYACCEKDSRYIKQNILKY